MIEKDTYLENLKGELSFVEAENAKHSNEVENLMKGYLEDSIPIAEHLEGLYYFSRGSFRSHRCSKDRGRTDRTYKVTEYEGNQIRLSLRTYIPETHLREQNHELAIELFDGTLELRNAKFFPTDVYIGEVINATKSFL
ncbi:hypothetical protein Tco_1139853 [Tanacetum coccineum]